MSKFEIDPPSKKIIAYSVDGAASAANISRTQIYEAIKSGDLVIHKMGRRSIILEADYLNWLASLPVVQFKKTAA